MRDLRSCVGEEGGAEGGGGGERWEVAGDGNGGDCEAQ